MRVNLDTKASALLDPEGKKIRNMQAAVQPADVDRAMENLECLS
jgi:hypothetical protein